MRSEVGMSEDQAAAAVKIQAIQRGNAVRRTAEEGIPPVEKEPRKSKKSGKKATADKGARETTPERMTRPDKQLSDEQRLQIVRNLACRP